MIPRQRPRLLPPLEPVRIAQLLLQDRIRDGGICCAGVRCLFRLLAKLLLLGHLGVDIVQLLAELLVFCMDCALYSPRAGESSLNVLEVSVQGRILRLNSLHAGEIISELVELLVPGRILSWTAGVVAAIDCALAVFSCMSMCYG